MADIARQELVSHLRLLQNGQNDDLSSHLCAAVTPEEWGAMADIRLQELVRIISDDYFKRRSQ